MSTSLALLDDRVVSAEATLEELAAAANREHELVGDALNEAVRHAEDREARAALARAGEHYRKMRDEIVTALGVA